ncbi:DNA cytosine methyltransferase [Pseudomonas sp. P2498]|uniref:DNA (cytosine-5-)-methyltransferase n=2 Tax=Pseudomonas petrae TaxID=2912190 RepID=A0ABS9IDE3_9PSED|nr:DNA cytosine methyltransferase [Pseudomonas petrae]MCF7540332.1 DNA cytosine methyltransferase [Pseudomonas petrae]MCF7545728.1 DNA cytosine methyltransferase [Pseudomonas petrae]MCF7558817.1 DNA cytosine methyltransferase [Pseudomonas petrae]
MSAAGLTVRLGIDIDEDAAATFRANFPAAGFLCADIRSLKAADIRKNIITDAEPRVFGACAPCQPFSKQNRQQKGDDLRRTLLPEFHKFVDEFQPEYIFIENVPGMQAVDKVDGPFAKFLALLEDLNYCYDYKIVMAYHYGVPQRRRRLVLIASSLGPIKMPPMTHGPGTEQPGLPTVAEWIHGLSKLEAGQTDPDDPMHRAAQLSALNLERISLTPPGAGRECWPERLWLDCHKNYSGHTDVYGRVAWDKPASALTTRCISLSNGRFGHPEENRAISLREAACIQTFPRDFTFHGNLNSMARQVGNAVPVKMAEIFGNEFRRHYAAHRLAQEA